MKRFQAFLSLGLIAVLAGCWASVDETEWCVKTRYGAIKEAGMPSGFQMINIVDDVTCFDVTERQFPPGDADAVMTATATTSDPLDVQVTYQIVVQLNVQNMEQTYIDKRHERQIERDLNGAIISGLQDAVAAWSMQGIFSDRRTELADSIGTHVDGKLGDMAESSKRDWMQTNRRIVSSRNRTGLGSTAPRHGLEYSWPRRTWKRNA
jgi:regulator of protease activity HflC (stomatin/prohibitin superfamily)